MALLLLIGGVMVMISAAVSLTFQELAADGSITLRTGHILLKNYNSLTLQDIPVDIPWYTQALLIANNNVATLSNQFWTSKCRLSTTSTLCCRFPYMVFIDLSDNRIESISSHSFSGMNWLMYIFLANNRLQNIPYDTFINNRGLIWISVSGNRIQYIDPMTFQNCTYLEMIFLERNMINSFHCDTFKGLEKLLVLYIHDNHIKELSSNIFRGMTSLKILKINNNSLAYIPELLFQNSEKLEILDASHNQICKLGKKFFSYAGKFTKCNISYNSIKKITKFVYQDIARLKQVDLSFNRLESVYLSRIPTSLYVNNGTNILFRDIELCTGAFKDVPCFADYYTGSEYFFHHLNFSYNNISKIFFSKNDVSHTLEILEISLAGNPRLTLPITFVKQERYITYLNLDRSNLNWMNITLFNEITLLPYLMVFSITGSPACEHFMRQVLLSVFNPDLRINIICGEENTPDTDLHYSVTPFLDGNGSNESLQSVADDQRSCPDIPEEGSGNNISNTQSYYPCHIFDTETIIEERILHESIRLDCKYTFDCSYVSHNTLPIINSSATCVILSYGAIQVLEPNYFLPLRHLDYLDLSFNMFSNLHDGMFRTLHKLRILKLNNNKLVQVSDFTFMGLPNLSVLTLHGNKISSFETHTLAHLWQLDLLSIDFCNLTTFHEDTFVGLKYLRTLHMTEALDLGSSKQILSYKHFEDLTNLETLLTEGFSFYPNITGMLFSNNSLRRLKIANCLLPVLSGDVFRTIEDVENVIFSHDKIAYLENDTFLLLSKLIQLDISVNEITFIHENAFVKTINLMNLNISHNQIRCISLQIFGSLTNLSYLDLSFNQIIILEWRNFAEIAHVKRLYIEGNIIEYFNNEISRYPYFNLSAHVNSSYNKNSLPKCFAFSEGNIYSSTKINESLDFNNVLMPRKRRLHTLLLKRNSIRNIMFDAFTYSPNLQNLILAFNKISDINEETFASAPLLNLIDLSYNSLTVLKNNVFKNLTFLNFLDLKNNKLDFIEEGSFRDLHSLVLLRLAFNKLKVFDLNDFAKPNKLLQINLSNNYLSSLNLTNNLLYLTFLYIDNNPLAVDAINAFKFMPSLRILYISNTSLCDFPSNSFENLSVLNQLTLADKCLRGLSRAHFSPLQRLSVLNMSLQDADSTGLNTHLNWKNITLINFWFEMPQLVYLVLTGNPICDNIQSTQILQNIFLSEKWKMVICSAEYVVPNFIISPDSIEVLGIRDHNI